MAEEINLKEGEDFYLENGLMVFTKKFLLKRGYCCMNGCRHCPYSTDSNKRSGLNDLPNSTSSISE